MLEVIYHPLVKRDVAEALKYYTDISARLADEFQAEVREIISQAADNPLRFHPTQRGFRRANLRRFPYHILYELKFAVIACGRWLRHALLEGASNSIASSDSGAKDTRSPNASRLPSASEPREASGVRACSPPLSVALR